MLYHVMGKSGLKISAISFGAMRWASEEDCCKIMNHGLDQGLNYVDTSTGYEGGNCEPWAGNAVRKRRSEIYFSAKGHWNSSPSADQVRRTLEESLKKTGLDYFDFYQVWGLQTQEVLTGLLARGGTVGGVRKAMDEGIVKHGLGFTFHGTPDVFRAAIDSREFLCATVSYNLMNRQEEENIAYAAARGVGTIIMNPLAGGILGLAGDRSLDFLRDGEVTGPAWGALRFLLANRNITTSIVGFSAPWEIDEAMKTLPGAESLGEDYRHDLIRRMDAVKPIDGNFCTECGYCKECPSGVRPTRLMKIMRDFVRYAVAPDRLEHWLLSQTPHSNIRKELSQCTACAQCEQKCPQHLKIVEQIERAKKALGLSGTNG
jgi:uncharacterized protein